MTIEQIMISLIKDYKWDESFPFQVMKGVPIARGSIEGIHDPNYRLEVYRTYGLVLFLTDSNLHSYFCLPKVAKEIEKEKDTND